MTARKPADDPLCVAATSKAAAKIKIGPVGSSSMDIMPIQVDISTFFKNLATVMVADILESLSREEIQRLTDTGNGID
jgi:hypothetical protein